MMTKRATDTECELVTKALEYAYAYLDHKGAPSAPEHYYWGAREGRLEILVELSLYPDRRVWIESVEL